MVMVEYLPRLIEGELDKWMEREEFIIIKGPRQSGKTTLLNHLTEKYKGEYFTLEDPSHLELFDKDPKGFVEMAKSKFIFLDEAQYSRNAGKNLKLIYDLYKGKVKLVVSGSGSFDVKVPIGSYLVGRCVYFDLLPLNFGEFLLWKNERLFRLFRERRNALLNLIKGEEVELKDVVLKRSFLRMLNEFLVFGGFPKVVKESEKEEVLRNLTITYLERDVNFFFNVFHLENFRKLMKYLAFNLGDGLELSRVSREIGISFQTLQRYISVLVHTYVIELVPPFHRNVTTEIKRTNRFYFIDVGMRNFLLNDFRRLENRIDKGKLYENFVLIELRGLGEIKYWRTKTRKEVDFVLETRGEFIPIEVKAKPRVTKGLRKFIKVYKPRLAIVFNEEVLEVDKIGETKVIFAPIFYI